MKVATVFQGEAQLYATSSVHFVGRELAISRLNDDDDRLVANLGPHFGILQPHVPLEPDNFQCRFKADGTRSIGSVSYLSGAWARDGGDAYDLSRIDAVYAHEPDGLKMRIGVQVGDPINHGAAYNRTKSNGLSYIIDVTIPFSDYLDFWGFTDPTARAWQRDRIAEIFGPAAVEAVHA